MTRDRSAQETPPADLATFPVRHQKGPLWRAARRSPWWYCTCGKCRFDLSGGRGTCYLGTDELCGVIEVVGPALEGGVIAPEFLNQRRLFQWEPDAPVRTGNLVSRRAVGFDVTNELSSITPYDLPQQWAVALDGVVEGITYRTRFDTGSQARGVAHFGPAGLAARRPGPAKRIGKELLGRLTSECGINVEPRPTLAQLPKVETP